MNRFRRMRGSAGVSNQARELRKSQTKAEKVLWERLRRKQLDGLKFRRQHPIGRFIVDFYCAEARLVIEVDGDIHASQEDYDQARTEVLEGQDYTVLRFSNDDVLNATDQVISQIKQHIEIAKP